MQAADLAEAKVVELWQLQVGQEFEIKHDYGDTLRKVNDSELA